MKREMIYFIFIDKVGRYLLNFVHRTPTHKNGTASTESIINNNNNTSKGNNTGSLSETRQRN
jgi:hypothetical protein